jgi:hypothetical protein
MTELSTNLFLAAGQMLLDEQERAFVAACDAVYVIRETGDGWPGIRMLDPTSAALEVVNSQSLRMRLDPASAGAKKIALLLMRHRDGQHLIIHGHIAAASESVEGEPRVRISVASCSWSPDASAHIDPAVARALKHP